MQDQISHPAQLSAETPYLSVVATSRNDNHGGDLLLRMQLFINGLADQCRRFQLPTELILVEWNPPADKPRLTEALTWPEDNLYLTCRVIEVPRDLHLRLEHAERLFMYQMIAKNVGIRRARGTFVLATNIDILFADSLMARIARRDLEANRMYRVDRYDTEAQLSVGMPFDEQVALCRAHVIRVFASEGIRLLTQDGWKAEDKVGLPEASLREAVPAAHVPKWRQTVTRLLTIARLSRRAQEHKKELSRHLALLQQDFGNPAPYERWLDLYERMPVHTAACGDFTMLAYEDWMALTGYAEFEMYSFHIDSLFCLCAHAAGVQEVCWPDPMYHLEHEGGWVPEPDKKTRLLSSLQKRSVPLLSSEDVTEHHITMQKTRKPLFFNKENWGLRDENLPETVYSARTTPQETVSLVDLRLGRSPSPAP